MSLRTKVTSVAVVSILGASACACSGATTATTDSGAAALDAPNGDVAPAAAEAPAFDDAEVRALAPMDPSLADTTDDATNAAAAMPGAKSYHVLLVWGHLPAPHDADDTDPDPKRTDWTGSVSVDSGAIGLKRTIAFDANDSVAKRTDPRSVAFTSHTLPYVDGLLLRVVVAAGGSSLLHFATTSLTTDVDLAQLDAKVGGVTRLADDEEGLGYVGYADDPGCAKGFVHGRWVKDRASFGHFRGIVSGGDGDAMGHVRGLWGHAPKRAADVFFGKYIDPSGQSLGLVGGTYGGGTLQGLWGVKDEHDVDTGRVEGFYSDGYDKADGRGVWLGRWSERCAK